MKQTGDKPIRWGGARGAALLLALLLLATGTSAAAADVNVTQNWPAAAVYYNSPCPNTETFLMTEEEFLAQKVELEGRVVLAYSALLHSLSGKEQSALKRAQKAWIDCYYAYLTALEQTWNEPIKIYYGVANQERRTNAYREICLVMLMNRAYDLCSWQDGRFASVERGAAEEKTAELREARRKLQVDMGLCLYVTTEDYREKITAAHRAFYAYLDADQAFVSLCCGGEKNALAAEGLLQVQRMSYLTHVHYQGCRFFHREREE